MMVINFMLLISVHMLSTVKDIQLMHKVTVYLSDFVFFSHKMVKTVKNFLKFCEILLLVWCYIVDFCPGVPKACNYRCMCCRTSRVSGQMYSTHLA
jgi:uncharacterized protein YqhQ